MLFSDRSNSWISSRVCFVPCLVSVKVPVVNTASSAITNDEMKFDDGKLCWVSDEDFAGDLSPIEANAQRRLQPDQR